MKKIWNKTPKWALLWGSIFLSVYIAFNLICPSGTWRYKMIVSIETPEGIKTGSTVREFSNCACWIDLIPIPSTGANPPDDFKGEAVVIDLGERGVVFAVMGTDDYYNLYNAFPIEGASTPSGIRYYNSLKNAKASLALKDRPLMVMFTDMKDPKTVTSVYRVAEGVDHAGQTNGTFTAEDQFEKVFGEGARLADVTIETTNEPVTSVVGEYLGWLEPLKGKYLHGGNTSREAPLGLYGGNFKRGE